MPTITRDDLLIPEDEQQTILAALANSEIVDPWTPAISQAVNKVDAYTAAYVLSADHYKRLVRPIVLWLLYALTGGIPEAKQKLYEDALKELEQIRDGKFTNLTPAPSTPSDSTHAGNWGSEDKIRFRS